MACLRRPCPKTRTRTSVGNWGGGSRGSRENRYDAKALPCWYTAATDGTVRLRCAAWRSCCWTRTSVPWRASPCWWRRSGLPSATASATAAATTPPTLPARSVPPSSFNSWTQWGRSCGRSRPLSSSQSGYWCSLQTISSVTFSELFSATATWSARSWSSRGGRCLCGATSSSERASSASAGTGHTKACSRSPPPRSTSMCGTATFAGGMRRCGQRARRGRTGWTTGARLGSANQILNRTTTRPAVAAAVAAVVAST
mmetsp:Transcript_33975/g.74324  ORF Transcript_33975/g.74324 Transcript_33975/m.74324 type:complete len:257 (+) Transcript_33975:1155-1925(+)